MPCKSAASGTTTSARISASRDTCAMFTGIIEEIGTVGELKRGSEPSGGAKLIVRARKALAATDGPKLQEGESIAVNGVCVTAREITAETFSADLAPETLARASLGSLPPRPP